MDKVDAFINKWKGQALDTDGFPPQQPFQCYDVFIQYLREVVVNDPSIYFSAQLTGYAADIYNQYDSSATLQKYFDKLPWNAQGQRGDVAVWGISAALPQSHVGLLEADNGVTQRLFGQNQPYPYCTEINMPYQGLLGYLRPKFLNQPAQQPQGGNDVPAKANMDTARILTHGILARNGLKGRGYSLDGSGDTDLNNGHVGRDLTNEYIQELFLSPEGRQWRDTQDPNAVQGINAQLDSLPQLQSSLNTANATITSLQQQLAAFATRPTQEQLVAIQAQLDAAVQKAQDEQAKLNALITQQAAATATGNSFLLWLGGILSTFTKK